MLKDKNNILFSIITYHPNPHQLKNLLIVLKPYQVLIVDNTKNNLGYAQGANKAIKEALKQKADWVIILNQDLTVSPAFLQKFVSLLNTSKPAIIGPFVGALDKKRWTTILPENSKFQAQNSKRIKNFGFNNYFEFWIWNFGLNHYISGSFIAIHKKVIEEVGNFYQPYFMYYEDADYCVRSQKAGFSVISVKIPGITHHDTSSLGQNSFLHEYYLARNHLLFVKRNAPLLVKIHEFFRFPKTIYEHLKNKNQGALTGIKDYLIGKYGKFPFAQSRLFSPWVPLVKSV